MPRSRSREASRCALSVAGILASGIVLAGCSLLYASDLSAARDFDPSDGGSDAPLDAAQDERLPDADGSDGATPTGCAAIQPPPKFCKDWEDGKPLADGWDSISLQSGTVTEDPSLAFSGSRSARVQLNGAPLCSYTRFEREIKNVGSKRLSVSVRFRPSSPWSATGFAPLALRLNGSTSQSFCALLLYVNADTGGAAIGSAGINVQAPSPPNDVRSLDGFPRVDEWSRIEFVVTPATAGTGKNISVAFTGAGGNRTVRAYDFSQCPTDVRDLDVNVGFHCNRGSATVNYDDVAVDWE